MELQFLRDLLTQQKEKLALNEEMKVGMTVKLRDAADKRIALTKEVKKLQQELKFERIACEGAKKKGAIFEFDIVGLREENSNLVAEQSLHRRRIGELEYALNEERSKRLKDMHEIEKLNNMNCGLETKVILVERDAFKANTELLEKVQKLETATLLNESKARVIYSQSSDLNNLSGELFRGKAEERVLHNTILTTVDELNSTRVENTHLKAELSRIRKDFLGLSVKQSDKSRAFLGTQSRVGTRGSVTRATSSTGMLTLSDLHFTDSQADSSLSVGSLGARPRSTMRSRLSVVTPITSPYRPQSISPASSPVQRSTPSIAADTFAFEPLESFDSFPNIEPPFSPVSKQNKISQADKPKTLYVGSGLGLKQEPMTSPKGSAKMMLRKIMDDFNAP